MKRLILVTIILLSFMGVTGCCIKHEWVEATCTEPRKCVKCGETEGEMLGHNWEEASCSKPKTCIVCSETEGVALEHQLTEANYQQPATCTVCSEEVGEVLQPDFEKYGIECKAELNKIYDAMTMCYSDKNITTSPKVVFTNYRRFESDKEHPAKEGYEWKTIDVFLFYYDENAWNYGMSNQFCFENYYDIITNDESYKYDENTEVGTFTVNYLEKEYSECQEYETIIENMGHNEWIAKTCIFTKRMHVLLPKGYDGYVFGVRNKQTVSDNVKYIYEMDNTDTILFRFSNLEDIDVSAEAEVQDINMSSEVAKKAIDHFYMNMLNYFDEDVIGFFDRDGDMSISQEESQGMLAWALDNYNAEHATVLSDEAMIKAAADYISGKLNVPDKQYHPFE